MYRHGTDKLQGIPKIICYSNIVKNRMDFPMHEQSKSSSKTEAVYMVNG